MRRRQLEHAPRIQRGPVNLPTTLPGTTHNSSRLKPDRPGKSNFSATWTTLGLTSDWICPKVGDSISLTGNRKLVWLRTLNNSPRNWNSLDSVNRMFLKAEKSQFTYPGPSTALRPSFPNTANRPRGSGESCWNALAKNVGFLGYKALCAVILAQRKARDVPNWSLFWIRVWVLMKPFDPLFGSGIAASEQSRKSDLGPRPTGNRTGVISEYGLLPQVHYSLPRAQAHGCRRR